MHKNPSNIVLIGMPGSGKSTVGIVLAKLISCNFVDTDVLIQISQGRTLQDIVDTEGYMALREIEERILLKLDCFDHVIATGGSAVYSHAAMTHLKSRIRDFATRGLAKRPDQSIEDLFEERFVLYTKYADVTIECKDFTQEEVCKDIISSIPPGWGSLRRQNK